MSSQHLLIDNVAFAKRNEHAVGDIMLADFVRLSDLLRAHALGDGGREAKVKGQIHYVLDGKTDAIGRNFLHLAINANLTVICQRCLDIMPLELDISFDYLITDQKLQDADAEEDDDFDMQEASQAMDLLALIEDELIMAIPMAPMHENNCGSGVTESGEKSNPFSALKGLFKS